jgi:hypothetical protein
MQIDDLVARGLRVLQRRGDLLRCQVAALAALGDDVAQLVDLGERHLRQERTRRNVRERVGAQLRRVVLHDRRIGLYE